MYGLSRQCGDMSTVFTSSGSSRSMKNAGPICALNGVPLFRIIWINSSYTSCNDFPMKKAIFPMNGIRGKVFKSFIWLSIFCTCEMYLMRPSTTKNTHNAARTISNYLKLTLRMLALNWQTNLIYIPIYVPLYSLRKAFDRRMTSL